jgi:LPS-assembly lipoprotein
MRLALPPTLLATVCWLAVVLLLAACGFQLRGAYSLPFESLYLAMPEYSVVGASLKRAIRASGSTRLALTASDAQATLLPGAEYRDRHDPLGLRHRPGQRTAPALPVPYRITDDKGRDLVAPGPSNWSAI